MSRVVSFPFKADRMASIEKANLQGAQEAGISGPGRLALTYLWTH